MPAAPDRGSSLLRTPIPKGTIKAAAGISKRLKTLAGTRPGGPARSVLAGTQERTLIDLSKDEEMGTDESQVAHEEPQVNYGPGVGGWTAGYRPWMPESSKD